MNKLLTYSILFTLTTSAYAEETSFLLNTPLQIASASNTSASQSNTSTTTAVPTATTTNAVTAPAETDKPAAVTSTDNKTTTSTDPKETTPSTPTTSNSTEAPNATVHPTAATATNSPTIDCTYKIPAETANVDTNIILKWAEHATQQSFDYDFNKIDTQITTLKTCYTDDGWKGFYDAFQKSGNLEAIKQEKLMVSSMVDGALVINPIKENQWKLSVPLQVVYQNDKEKLTQTLTVELVVGRKINGDLGIMQMIASPREGSMVNKSESKS